MRLRWRMRSSRFRPAGGATDYGSRRILTRIVLWWSFFTALTGAAGGFVSLVVIRFLFGAGEAGALPNSARILREWFPVFVARARPGGRHDRDAARRCGLVYDVAMAD